MSQHAVEFWSFLGSAAVALGWNYKARKKISEYNFLFTNVLDLLMSTFFSSHWVKRVFVWKLCNETFGAELNFSIFKCHKVQRIWNGSPHRWPWCNDDNWQLQSYLRWFLPWSDLEFTLSSLNFPTNLWFLWISSPYPSLNPSFQVPSYRLPVSR